MSQISIDVTSEEHQKLKALADLKGKSISEYIMERALFAIENSGEEQALTELESILNDRIRRAEAGEISSRTVGEIFEQAYREADGQSKA